MKLNDKLLVAFGTIGLICSLAFFVLVVGVILFAATFNSLNISACIKLGGISIITVGSSVTAIVIGSRNSRRK